ncbi:MAG: DUF1850 domain-containing protein [Oricola sp.]
MTGICIIAGGKTVVMALTTFTLSWTHSVEKTSWREHWAVDGQRLVLEEARVKGSGAGMDPGEGAVLEDDWWVWTPHSPEVTSLHLAASGATHDGWQICSDGNGACRQLGEAPGSPITIAPCPGGRG